MRKIYLSFLCTSLLCLSLSAMQAQPVEDGDTKEFVESVDIFPNPAKSNKLYITSKSGRTKMISAYNVLGERVMFEVLTTKELDISSLPVGVYILRIKVGKETFSKKLIRN